VRREYAELLTVAEVAEMARLSVGTLRWWRSVGAGGPPARSTDEPMSKSGWTKRSELGDGS
jgi:hypothetical protein